MIFKKATKNVTLYLYISLQQKYNHLFILWNMFHKYISHALLILTIIFIKEEKYIKILFKMWKIFTKSPKAKDKTKAPWGRYGSILDLIVFLNL